MPELTLKLDPKGNLIDPGTAELTPKDPTVVWTIGDKNIDSFMIVTKVLGDPGPFGSKPPISHYTKADSATAVFTNRITWEYKIIWKTITGKESILDPKIAVKPDPTFSYWFFGLAIVLLISLGYFFFKKYLRRN